VQLKDFPIITVEMRRKQESGEIVVGSSRSFPAAVGWSVNGFLCDFSSRMLMCSKF